MENLESPYMQLGPVGLGQEVYTRREVKSLWEKVDEIVDWINEKEKEQKK